MTYTHLYYILRVPLYRNVPLLFIWKLTICYFSVQLMPFRLSKIFCIGQEMMLFLKLMPIKMMEWWYDLYILLCIRISELPNLIFFYYIVYEFELLILLSSMLPFEYKLFCTWVNILLSRHWCWILNVRTTMYLRMKVEMYIWEEMSHKSYFVTCHTLINSHFGARIRLIIVFLHKNYYENHELGRLVSIDIYCSLTLTPLELFMEIMGWD